MKSGDSGTAALSRRNGFPRSGLSAGHTPTALGRLEGNDTLVLENDTFRKMKQQ
jgi:hypothetical protein